MTATPPPVLSPEELARAFQAFNETTEGLARSHDALVRRVAALQAELAEKNHELALKTRLALLGEMAAGVAHEIRNPLGGIQLYLGLLERETAGQPGLALLVAKALSGVKGLAAIVTDLLAYTRPLPLSRSVCPLVPLAREALELAAAEIAGRGIEVRTGFEGPGPEAWVDPDGVRRVLLNLILNAAQAIEPGRPGTIDVRARSLPDGGALVSVRDTGSGIAPEDREKLFHPFWTKKARGTGLGLALAHRILEEHGARIAVESAPGQGSTFTLRFPPRPSHGG